MAGRPIGKNMNVFLPVGPIKEPLNEENLMTIKGEKKGNNGFQLTLGTHIQELTEEQAQQIIKELRDAGVPDPA